MQNKDKFLDSSELENSDNKIILNGIIETPQSLISWLKALTDLEQKVLSVLYQGNRAIPIKNIRHFIVQLSEEGIKEEEEKIFTYPFESFYYKEKGKQITYPSFERIEKTIQNLIKMRMVLERPSEDKKIKALYFLNPFIRNALDKEDPSKAPNSS